MFSADCIETGTSLPELAKWVRDIADLTQPDAVKSHAERNGHSSRATDEGSLKKIAAALNLALYSEPTPHPSRFARHLLPQGEKGCRGALSW